MVKEQRHGGSACVFALGMIRLLQGAHKENCLSGCSGIPRGPLNRFGACRSLTIFAWIPEQPPYATRRHSSCFLRKTAANVTFFKGLLQSSEPLKFIELRSHTVSSSSSALQSIVPQIKSPERLPRPDSSKGPLQYGDSNMGSLEVFKVLGFHQRTPGVCGWPQGLPENPTHPQGPWFS